MEFLSGPEIVLHIVVYRLWPVWLALALVMGASWRWRKSLGLYGQLYDSGAGIAGTHHSASGSSPPSSRSTSRLHPAGAA